MQTFERQANLTALALRLLMAVWFGYHFYFKWQSGFAANVDAFTHRGFPGVFGYLDMLAEIIVIPFLVLGIYSRFCMIALSPLMFGALAVFYPRGFNFSNGGFELPTLWLCCMWLLVIIGDGFYAVKLPKLPFDGRHPARIWYPKSAVRSARGAQGEGARA